MAETPAQTVTDIPSAKAESLPKRAWRSFSTKHPRTAKGVAITGVVVSGLSVAHVVRTISAKREHLANAVDHAGDALNEVAASVSPTDPEA